MSSQWYPPDRDDHGVWYQDGTVVLRAQSMTFRVYKGVLAQYSPVFRDMLRLPQALTEEYYDDCPLVELAGDEPFDLCHLLRAIHNIAPYVMHHVLGS